MLYAVPCYPPFDVRVFSSMTSVRDRVQLVIIFAAFGLCAYIALLVYKGTENLASLQSEIAEKKKLVQDYAAKAPPVAPQGEKSAKAPPVASASADQPAEAPGLAEEMAASLGKLRRLRALMSSRPELMVPEVKLLSQKMLFQIASKADLESEGGIRTALAELRFRAENDAVSLIRSALNSYVMKNAGMLPQSPAQLAEYFGSDFDPAILGRYEMAATGRLTDLSPRKATSEVMIIRAPVDVERDWLWRVGVSGYSPTSALTYDINQAQKKFAEANGGLKATDASQLTPFLKWPVDQSVLQKQVSGGTPKGPK
jgi:hypothetical protein